MCQLTPILAVQNSYRLFYHSISTRITMIIHYINNMAKRQANGETNSLDKKFEIDTDTFVVVTNFNGHLLVHIRNTMENLQQKRGLHIY